MINLEKRIEHWSHGWTAQNQGDSDPVPFSDYVEYFTDKDVLEIGPGEGRQYNAIRHLCRSYAIADISQQVLDCPVFSEIRWKLLLRDYRNDNFNQSFDLIHFWYVLHHVPRADVHDFFHFAIRNLRMNGILMFNTPFLGFHEGAYADDGVQTTRYGIGEIVALLKNYVKVITIDDTKIGRSNGCIFIGKAF